MNVRFMLREIVHSRSQVLIFIFCVMLSLISIVAINSFRRDVQQAILSDAKGLHGADIVIHSHHDFSSVLLDEIVAVKEEFDVSVIRTWEFYSVVRREDGADSLLCNIKAVEEGYPHYGSVDVASGRALSEVLRPGQVVVAESLLERLGLKLGDLVILGDAKLLVSDVIKLESMRPVDFVNFGPRILVTAEDLAQMGLIGKGSRVHFGALVKTADELQMEPVEKRLQKAGVIAQERITTYKNQSSRIKKFFDNLLFFLSLVSVFTLLLAGIGMQSSLGALLRRKQKSLAIMRSLGATGSFLLGHYLGIVLLITLVGCGLGILGGALFEKSFVLLFSGLLPDNIVLGISFWDVFESVVLGLLVVMFFTYLPLQEIREVRPAKIFRKDNMNRSRKSEAVVLLACGVILLSGLIIRQLEDIETGLYFVTGLVVLIFFLFLLATAVLAVLSKITISPLVYRQAIRSLMRPGNATRSIIVTLASAIAVLFSIYLVEMNLYGTYIASYPADAPNLFCLDIQKNQRQPFLDLVGEDTELFPVIRARLVTINAKKIERKEETIKRGDSLTREFNLTYREELLKDEVLESGASLFGDFKNGSNPVPVSVLDSVAELGDMQLGDILGFNIQGVPLNAVVSSIRSRTKSMLYPFFYFVFRTQDLQAAPQTFFGALTVEKAGLAQLENRIVNTFPNISPINVSETAAELGLLMQKLSRIVNFFASFSILAGGLILVSSILATRIARVREAVYYKVLGGGRSFVLKVFFMENLTLAFLSSCCGIVVAQLSSWLVCRFIFNLSYNPGLFSTLLVIIFTAVLLTSLGLLSSISIVNRKPVQFLSDQG